MFAHHGSRADIATLADRDGANMQQAPLDAEASQAGVGFQLLLAMGAAKNKIHKKWFVALS